jgi:hypothetical protein
MVKLRLFLFLFLTSCQTTQPTIKVNLTSVFDKALTEKMLLPGKNTIKGSALINQKGGGVVTCAGKWVGVRPATAYAQERILNIYGNSEGGGVNVNYAPGREFIPDNQDYYTLYKRTVCDPLGFFIFEDLADGDFFVFTDIYWEVQWNAYYTSVEGATMVRKISVKNGEVKTVHLSNN